jgi:uncharacterized MAPEG superfamily protein
LSDIFALSALLTASTATKATIVRAEGAQQNGFENIGLFAAAVVIGNVAKLDNWTLNALSAAYLASRVAYNALYITGTTEAMGMFSFRGHAWTMLMFQ